MFYILHHKIIQHSNPTERKFKNSFLILNGYESGYDQNKKPLQLIELQWFFEFFCAQNRTRTCTSLRSLVPETSVSTNFTIWAMIVFLRTFFKT